MRVRHTSALVSLLLAVLLTRAPFLPAPSPPAPEDVLASAGGRDSQLNPLLAVYNPVDRDITSQIFEGLTATNAYGEIEPRLAESWVIAESGLQYIVTLRDDVLWHDGVPQRRRRAVHDPAARRA